MPSSAATGARHLVMLDGAWEFRHESQSQWRGTVVPMPWQAAFADLRHSSGRAVYRRSFDRPQTGAETVLRFGAVSYHATVRLNGTEVGSHEGGYLPFEIVLPQGLLADRNEVEVDCLLPDGDPATAPEFPFAEIPHGKQSWYGPIGGIWQSVVLETRDPCHVTHCGIVAELSTGRVNVSLELPPATAEAQIRLSVVSSDGAVVATQSVAAAGAAVGAVLDVDAVAPWSPDAPNLYVLRVELYRDGLRDSSDHSFGFRTIETRDGRIVLNGAPFYMRAALDQDYYPEGIATPPSLAFLEDQLHKAKALGLNMLRCHIKVPDPRYYEVADRLGMLIWTEIPNVGVFTDASARRMRDTMEGILRRDANHPCIVIWTLINEDWGTRLCEDPAHRAWLAETYDWLKARDPTRLVVDNSPCHGNFHVKTDLNDFHYYRSVPERRAEWDALTLEFAGGADWTWSPFGDAARRGDEPLLVSEFGVWGLPDPAQVTIDGAEPWWMETGGTWGDGVAYPHGIQNRFATLGLASVFGGFAAFIAAAQWYQFANLKYQIESMRGWPSIMGYVITEFTDVHWESNGLLDMNRNPRVFHDVFRTINADVVIVPKVGQYSGTAGTPFRFGIAVATGGRAIADGVLTWRAETGETGAVEVPATGPLGSPDLGEVVFMLPATDRNRMLRIDLTLSVGDTEAARNSFEIASYAPRNGPGVAVAVRGERIAAHLAGLGVPITGQDEADVTVVNALTAADIARMQAGARYLVLADGTEPTRGNLRVDGGRREQPFIRIVDETPGLPVGSEAQQPNINLIARHGTMWRGDWIAGFSWIRRTGVFADMPGGPLVDLSFDRVIPHHVMTGFRAWEFGAAVHAGIVVGWVHKPAALIAERRVGRGGLVASTFRVMTEAPGSDPVAGYLFDALLRLAAQMVVDGPIAGRPAEANRTRQADIYLQSG